MHVDESGKIGLIEQRVGERLAPLGFSVDAKTGMDIEFSRTVGDDGVRQTILVTHSRYADMVCARYFSSNAFMPVQAAGMVLDFMKEQCPWARPAEGEWVWYDGDADFPNAVDKLIFIIEGVGLDVLGMLSAASGEDVRAARERSETERTPPEPGRPPEEAVPQGWRAALGLSRGERTALVESAVGAVLLPLGFSFDGWDDFSDWDFHRYVKGDFDVIATDRRGLYVVGSDTAEQRVRVSEDPGTPLLGLRLSANTFSPGERSQAIMLSLMERAAADHPDMVQGLWFAYRDEESYAEALGKIADVLARYGAATLDALCEREKKEG